MIAFIDDHREAHGVEPICRVLPIAPSTYHDHVVKRADPKKLSARAKRDLELKPEIERVFRRELRGLRREEGLAADGARGLRVARCTVERLMADLGLHGVIRGKPIRTTVQDKAAPCPLDRVNRVFHAPARTCSGFRTSPTSAPGRASSTWHSSSTPMPAASSAGG
jgi:putative transposase